MYAIRSYYACARRLIVPDTPLGERFLDSLVASIRQLRVGLFDDDPQPYMGCLISTAAAVITSYSIHYTKLYEVRSGDNPQEDRSQSVRPCRRQQEAARNNFV